MNVMYLAFSSDEFEGDSFQGWQAVIFTGLMVVATLLIPLTIGALTFWFIRRNRQTKIAGPALTGSAQVLSVTDLGGVGGSGGDGDGIYFPSRSTQYVKRIGLRVQVAGCEPYEATITQHFVPGQFNEAMVGRTVPVQVEAANPKHVQIVLSTGQQSRVGFSGAQPDGASAANQFGGPFKVTMGSGAQNFQFKITSPNVADQAAAFAQSQGAGPVLSAADLLASGQRVPGVLASFAPTGTTPRSLGRSPSRPELIDAPHYALEVELQFPNLAPVDAKAIQPVPVAQVPNLAIGRKLACAVDPADPAHRFVVDWDQTVY